MERQKKRQIKKIISLKIYFQQFQETFLNLSQFKAIGGIKHFFLQKLTLASI